MHHSSMSWEITFCTFLAKTLYDFYNSSLSKCKISDFCLLTKFHQSCTFIGYFCWKYIKFLLKKYRGVMSHDTEEWSKIWRKIDLLFQKWQESGEFWFEHSSLQNLHCDLSPVCKVYNIGPKKYRGVVFNDTEESCIIWRKTGLWFGKWPKELGTFSSEHLKVPNWYFHGIILSKIENAWVKNLQRSYV